MRWGRERGRQEVRKLKLSAQRRQRLVWATLAACRDLVQGKGGASQPPPSLSCSRAASALGPPQPSPILSSIYDHVRSISGI